MFADAALQGHGQRRARREAAHLGAETAQGILDRASQEIDVRAFEQARQVLVPGQLLAFAGKTENIPVEGANDPRLWFVPHAARQIVDGVGDHPGLIIQVVNDVLFPGRIAQSAIT